MEKVRGKKRVISKMETEELGRREAMRRHPHVGVWRKGG